VSNQANESELEDSTQPYWVDNKDRCSFRSAVGIELGHIECMRFGGIGRGGLDAGPMWFSYLKDNEKPVFPRGITEPEEAKKLVEEYCEINLGFENEYALEIQRRRGKRR
jgi:hypothetical protein